MHFHAAHIKIEMSPKVFSVTLAGRQGGVSSEARDDLANLSFSLAVHLFRAELISIPHLCVCVCTSQGPGVIPVGPPPPG